MMPLRLSTTLLLVASLVQGAFSFSTPHARLAARLASPSAHPSLVLYMSDGGEDAAAAEDVPPPKPGKEPVDPMPPAQMMKTPPSPPPKRLDPLLASLTRVDPNASSSSAETPTTKIPLLGEVTMDKSLFVVLPTVAFAVLGFLLTFVVAYNSRDVFVNSIDAWNDSVMNPPSKVIDPNECRGLCSTQEQDLEGLKSFMNGLGGQKK